MHQLWLRCQQSVFSLTFENAEGRISSGTGFKVGGFLVTNNHVVQVPTAKHIVLRSVAPDGHTTVYERRFGRREFSTLLVDGDPEESWDYAVLKIEDPSFAAIPSLDLVESSDIRIGDTVGLFGFQFEQPQLSMHMGYLSSQYYKAGVHYLQLDSSVNHGNSGGPLLDAQTGRVVGVVTRKATGLTGQFDELLQSFKQNITQLRALQSAGSFVTVGGIDPVAATVAMQSQMERIARELSRSANVGIGYAYHASKVRVAIGHLLGQSG